LVKIQNNPQPDPLYRSTPYTVPERVAEVEDFVDFLRTRDEERALVRAASKASEPAFAKIWDNDDDAAYDRL